MLTHRIFTLIAASIIVVIAVVSGCETSEDKEPYLIINVNLDEVTYPVSKTHKLYGVFYLNKNWTKPFLILSSDNHRIIFPRLGIGDFPFYFEVVYDVNADGEPSLGDIFQGWNGKIDRALDLNPIVLPHTDLMMLNIDLDNNGTIL